MFWKKPKASPLSVAVGFVSRDKDSDTVLLRVEHFGLPGKAVLDVDFKGRKTRITTGMIWYSTNLFLENMYCNAQDEEFLVTEGWIYSGVENMSERVERAWKLLSAADDRTHILPLSPGGRVTLEFALEPTMKSLRRVS